MGSVELFIVLAMTALHFSVVSRSVRANQLVLDMKIKLYIDDVLKEECTEEGFVVLLGTETMIINLFSAPNKKDIVFPYSEKKYSLPNGALYTIRISTSPAFQEACNIMKQFKDLKFIEICDGNAKLQIDY